MQTEPSNSSNPSKPPRVTASDLVVALFTDSVSVGDALADLRQAGFDASRIAIAVSPQGGQAAGQNPAKHSRPQPVSGKHSMIWKFRHSFERDLHHRAADQSAEEENTLSRESEPLYSQVDLEEILLGLGVTEDRIHLLDREIGVNGTLMFVEAGHRSDEVQSILERNCGLIRTDMATEHPPVAR